MALLSQMENLYGQTTQQSTAPNQPTTVNPSTINFQSIKQLRDSGQLEKAKNDAITYLKQYPKDADVILLLGTIYYQQRSFANAAIMAKTVLVLSPQYEDARALLIRIYIATQQYRSALIEVNIGLQKNPSSQEFKTLQTLILKALQQQQTLEEEKNIQETIQEGLPNIPMPQFRPTVEKSLPVLPPPKIFKKEPALPTSNVFKKEPTLDYKEIQKLKQAGQLKKAKEEAYKHLKVYPKDYDVMLILGLIYYQEKNFSNAKSYALQIIKSVPKYLDARLLLIRIYIAQGKLEEAQKEWKKSLVYGPKSKDLKEVKINIDKAIKEKTQKSTRDKKKSEEKKPDTPMQKVANCYYERRQYNLAAEMLKVIFDCDPNDKKAKGMWSDIEGISPKYTKGLNEFGIISEEDYVTDLKEYWNYSSLYLLHHARPGDLNFLVNYTHRRGLDGYQEEVLFSPILDKNSRIDLDLLYSDRFELFPNYAGRIEGYYNIPDAFEISLGEYYANLRFTSYKYFTTSLAKETTNIYSRLRLYHYTPKEGPTSMLYVLNLRIYPTKDNDLYVWANLGAGKSPDLNDLITVDFITIKNHFIYLGVHFPVDNNRLAFTLGLDYQHQVFPSGLVRELKGGIAGISIRF